MITANTINNIVVQIYNNKKYIQTIKNINQYKSNSEEAISHIMSQLLENKKPETLIDIFNHSVTANTSDFIYYFTKICLNQFRSETSSYFKAYKNTTVELFPGVVPDLYEEYEDPYEDEIKVLNRFKGTLTQLQLPYYVARYEKGYSYRKMATDFKLPTMTCYFKTKEVQELLLIFLEDNNIQPLNKIK